MKPMNLAAPTLAEADSAPFAHTPFDGSRKAFSVGLAPLDLAEWIEPDAKLAASLAQREALIRDKRDLVLREEPGTRASQREALELVVAHVTTRYPDLYRLEGRRITVLPTGRSFDLDDDSEAPLAIAGHLISDDLLILTRTDAGYRLVAAVLCFPSAWSLADRFGQTLDGLHEAVPGYQSKLAKVMNRIFENLKVDQPVWRLNWSIYPDDELHHPESRSARATGSTTRPISRPRPSCAASGRRCGACRFPATCCSPCASMSIRSTPSAATRRAGRSPPRCASRSSASMPSSSPTRR